MRLSIKAAMVAASLPFCFNVAAHAQNDNPNASLEEAIDRQVTAANIDGAVLVAQGGQVLFKTGYGEANREWQVKNTAETRFRIASMSKSFTAVLIMQLVEAGKIDLEAPFRRYLPEYPSDHADRITVYDLLRHQSGIKHYAELPGWRDGKYRPPMTDEAFTAVFANEPLNFEPGSESRYSNSNYFLLGLIIETMAGKPYGDVLRTGILDPLGMENTGEFSAGTIVDELAADYMPNGEEVSCAPASAAYCASGYVNMDLFQATGSLHSTVGDLLKWDQGLYGNDILSDESKTIVFDPDAPLAWNVGALPVGDTGDTVPVIAYNGGINGYTSFIARFPDSNHTVIILNNNGAGYNALVQATVGIAEHIFQ